MTLDQQRASMFITYNDISRPCKNKLATRNKNNMLLQRVVEGNLKNHDEEM